MAKRSALPLSSPLQEQIDNNRLQLVALKRGKGQLLEVGDGTMKRLPPVRRWLFWITNPCLTGILMSLVLGSPATGAANTNEPVAVNFPGKLTLLDGKLTAQIMSASLRQVMEEVSKLSGAQVHWLSHEDQDTRVSVEFADLPLSEALRRILGDKNFAFSFTSTKDGERLLQVWVFSKRQAQEQAVPTPLPFPQKGTSLHLSDSPPPVEQDNDALIQIALLDQDPLTRLDAITQLGGYAREDQRVKMILHQVADSDSNQQVQEAAKELLQNMEENEK